MSFGEIKFLVDFKANIFEKDDENKTPLFNELSKYNFNEEIVKFLVEKKSDLKRKHLI